MEGINVFALVLCGLALVVSVVLNSKKNYPLGLLAMIASFIIGVGVMGMNVMDIISSFPGSTVLALLLAIPYFSTLASTGMLTIVGKRMLRLVHGDVRLLPLIALPAIGLVATVAGSQIPYIFGPLLIGIAQAGGLDLMVVLVLMAFAGATGAMNPWTNLNGQMISGFAQSSGFPNPEGMTLAVWVNAIIASVVIVAVGYIVFKGHKAKRVETTDAEDLTMNPQQKQAFYIFVGTIVLLLVPVLLTKLFPGVPALMRLNSLCNSNILFSIGILLCVLLKFNTFEGAMKRIPMTLVFLIVGIVMLLHVADAAGFSTLISNLISTNVPVILIPAVFTMAACIMSFFASSFTVMPVLWAVAVPVATATGISPAVLLTCVAFGAVTSGNGSPMSAGGAAILSVFPTEEQPTLFKRMLAYCLVACVITTVLALLGVFNIGAMIFGA